MRCKATGDSRAKKNDLQIFTLTHLSIYSVKYSPFKGKEWNLQNKLLGSSNRCVAEDSCLLSCLLSLTQSHRVQKWWSWVTHDGIGFYPKEIAWFGNRVWERVWWSFSWWKDWIKVPSTEMGNSIERVGLGKLRKLRLVLDMLILIHLIAKWRQHVDNW